MGFKLASLFLESLLDLDMDYSLTNLAIVTLDQEKFFPFNFLPTECVSIKYYTNYSQAKNHLIYMYKEDLTLNNLFSLVKQFNLAEVCR